MASIDDKKIEDAEAEAEEESGWTAYLEDFSCGGDSSVSGCSSLISDAAWNGPDSIRRLNLKKLRRSTNSRKYTYEYDDDLEDTASSPVNSPKVSTMKQMEVNHRRFNDIASCDFLGQQSSSNNFLRDERDTKKNIIENKTIDQYTEELKKRGLCLVPMSALINYIG